MHFQDKTPRNVVRFFIFITIYAMLMLVMIPIWNCGILLHSVTYSYFIGSAAPLSFIIVVSSITACFTVMILVFFAWTRPEVHTGQNLVMVGGIILTVLGMTFIIFGNVLAEHAGTAQKEVLHNCEFGPLASPLYREANMLLQMKLQPACAGQMSVAQCQGFTETTASRVIRDMEHSFRCSRFCSQGSYITLFSPANYTSSCQMMLARSLNHYVRDVGNQTYTQGLMLALACVAAFFLNLMGACIPKRWLPAVNVDILQEGLRKAASRQQKGERPPPAAGGADGPRRERSRTDSFQGYGPGMRGYGTTEPPPAPTGTMPRPRYVSQGVLR
jgi:hypothetical protein